MAYRGKRRAFAGISVFVSFLTAFSIAPLGSARAACGDTDGVRCYPDIGIITGVVWSGDGFTAVGQPKLPNPTYGLVLLRLTRSGQLKDTPIQVPLPSNVGPKDRPIAGESRKVIAIPDGGLVILGGLILGEDNQVPWAVRLRANGGVVWNRAFPAAEPGATSIFHSGIYDQANDRLVIVGRRASGPPDGKCSKWSQSLVTSLKMSNGQTEFQPLYSGPQTAGARSRQALLDIAVSERPNNYVVTGFASAPDSTGAGDCQDDVSVQTLSLPAQGGWTLSAPNRIGASDANEMGYAIKPVRPGSYLIAGYGKDASKGVPAAQAFLVKVSPAFSVVASTSTPFPLNGTDKDGGDRFRAIVPLLDKERFILVGSGSNGKKGANQGLWKTVQSDPRQSLPVRQFNNQSGSDIWDAAVSDNGKVLGVGRWTDDDRTVYGWSGFLEEFSGNLNSASKIPQISPDRSLTAVESLSLAGDAYQLPQAASQSGVAYLGKMLQRGSQVNFAFSLAAPRTVRIGVRPETGNLGLAVLDRDKRPLTFSNFGGTATELVITTLPQGDYTISVFAITDVKSYEVRLYPFVERDAFLSLQGLKDEQREDLSRKLVSAGYASSPETDIALGSETLRSIYALRQSAGDSRPISVTTLEPVVQIPAPSR